MCLPVSVAGFPSLRAPPATELFRLKSEVESWGMLEHDRASNAVAFSLHNAERTAKLEHDEFTLKFGSGPYLSVL